MDAKSIKLVFIGYSDDLKAYRCLTPETKRVHISREVTFFAQKLWDWKNNTKSDANIFAPSANMERESINTSLFESQSSGPSFEQPDNSHNFSEVVEPQSLSLTSSLALVRYKSLTYIYNCSFTLIATDPSLFEEALKHEQRMVTMGDEMESIQKNQTLELTILLEGKKVIG